MKALLMIFRRFPTTFRRFPKLFRRPDERFWTFSENFRNFPKMPEDFRRLPKTFEEDPKMFRWYTDEFKYNLRNKLDNIEIIDIFTREDIKSSHVRISYRFYQFVTTRYTTDFYVYVITWARGQLRINFTSIFKVFTKLPESRSDEGNLENFENTSEINP